MTPQAVRKACMEILEMEKSITISTEILSSFQIFLEQLISILE